MNQRTFNELPFFAMVALMYATVCMETDIYVPAFPDMKTFFLASDESIQQVLSLNFLGICLGSLLFGPLSDSYGRQSVLQIGLGLFAISSWGCLFFSNFECFLICRFIQGIGAAAPMVIAFAMLLDKYEPTRVAQLCGAINLFITGAMAASPLLGSWLILYFDWQANFFVIALLSSLSLLGSLFFVPETLAKSNRLAFSVKQILSGYGKVSISFPYVAGALVCYLLFAGIILFIANLSLIFIEHLGVSKSQYGFYQATTMGTFALFSILSVKIIGKYGTEKTKYSGLLFAFIGTALLFAVALVSTDPILICGAMMVYTIGATLAAPIYGIDSANVFPEMRGIASGMSNALRHVVVAGVVGIGSMIFNGSIQPVALVITTSSIMVLMLAVGLQSRKAITSRASA
jgi:DHA1 family bicyclomycin/chloramphenicol resistance-like MFS transporter